MYEISENMIQEVWRFVKNFTKLTALTVLPKRADQPRHEQGAQTTGSE